MQNPKGFLEQAAGQEAQKAHYERMRRDFAADRLPGRWKVTALLLLFLLIVFGVIFVVISFH